MKCSRQIIAFSVILFLAPVARAEENWSFRLFGTFHDTSGISSSDGLFQSLRVELSGDFGYGLGIERRLSDHWAIELSALRTDVEATTTVNQFVPGFGLFNSTQRFDFRFTPVTLGLNYGWKLGERGRLYTGPLLGIGVYDSYDPAPGLQVPVDNDFIYGAQLGVEVPIGRGKWGFNSSLRYLQSSVRLEETAEDLVDLDPLILTAGASFRF